MLSCSAPTSSLYRGEIFKQDLHQSGVAWTPASGKPAQQQGGVLTLEHIPKIVPAAAPACQSNGSDLGGASAGQNSSYSISNTLGAISGRQRQRPHRSGHRQRDRPSPCYGRRPPYLLLSTQLTLSLLAAPAQDSRFMLATQRTYDRQYAQLYYARLMALGPLLRERVAQQWPGIESECTSRASAPPRLAATRAASCLLRVPLLPVLL